MSFPVWTMLQYFGAQIQIFCVDTEKLAHLRRQANIDVKSLYMWAVNSLLLLSCKQGRYIHTLIWSFSALFHRFNSTFDSWVHIAECLLCKFRCSLRPIVNMYVAFWLCIRGWFNKNSTEQGKANHEWINNATNIKASITNNLVMLIYYK